MFHSIAPSRSHWLKESPGPGIGSDRSSSAAGAGVEESGFERCGTVMFGIEFDRAEREGPLELGADCAGAGREREESDGAE